MVRVTYTGMKGMGMRIRTRREQFPREDSIGRIGRTGNNLLAVSDHQRTAAACAAERNPCRSDGGSLGLRSRL